jgi:hypothetical protein
MTAWSSRMNIQLASRSGVVHLWLDPYRVLDRIPLIQDVHGQCRQCQRSEPTIKSGRGFSCIFRASAASGGTSLIRNQIKESLAGNQIPQFLDILQCSTVRCPQCGQRWIVGNMCNHDLHQCKSCGYRFAVKVSFQK